MEDLAKDSGFIYSKLLSYDMKVRPYVVAITRDIEFEDKTALNCVVANLLSCVRKRKHLAYSRNTNNRSYGRKGLNPKRIIKAVDVLVELGLVTNIIGISSANKYYRRTSLLFPTGGFIEKFFGKVGVSNEEDQVISEECMNKILLSKYGIYLTEAEKDYIDSVGGIILRDKSKQIVKFSKSKDISAMEEEVRQLNLLNHSHKVVDGEGRVLDNTYCRIFNERFDWGGRYYRADILNMPNHDDQRLDVTIDGNPVVEVDYNNLHIRLACAINGYGAESLGDDAYSSILDVSNKVNRKVVKLAINIMFNCDTKSKAYGAINLIIRGLTEEEKAEYTLGTAKSVVEMVIDAYPDLKHEFCTTTYFGKVLQNADSHIASDIIKVFVAKKIPILPVHDSFITTLDNKNFLCYTMGKVFRERLEVDYPVPLTAKWKEEGVVVRENVVE